MKKPTSWSKIGLGRWHRIYGEIVEFLEGLDEPVTVAREATRGWYWLYDLLKRIRMEVKLSHPFKTKVIASQFAREIQPADRRGYAGIQGGTIDFGQGRGVRPVLMVKKISRKGMVVLNG